MPEIWQGKNLRAETWREGVRVEGRKNHSYLYIGNTEDAQMVINALTEFFHMADFAGVTPAKTNGASEGAFVSPSLFAAPYRFIDKTNPVTSKSWKDVIVEAIKNDKGDNNEVS